MFKVGDEITIEQYPSLYEQQYEFRYEMVSTKEVIIFAVVNGSVYAIPKNRVDAFASLAPYNGCFRFKGDKVESWAWSFHPDSIRDRAISWYEQRWEVKIVRQYGDRYYAPKEVPLVP